MIVPNSWRPSERLKSHIKLGPQSLGTDELVVIAPVEQVDEPAVVGR